MSSECLRFSRPVFGRLVLSLSYKCLWSFGCHEMSPASMVAPVESGGLRLFQSCGNKTNNAFSAEPDRTFRGCVTLASDRTFRGCVTLVPDRTFRGCVRL
ncbi:hypothetical protein ElyMa_003015600 [Elysia marginata]|uniref:Secreted protein n=1 Tax=Elysia marginata TaxID=1093978 RepID=A0AAV4IF67_9GAST|nr:hypothetical protein ElyMa_003015600 [Elysia marginata]